MKPDVSVVIPTYNVQAYVEECLESVFASKGASLEVIVVDNNSDDGTLLILKALQERYGFLLLHEPKQGGSAARNRGLQHARAEWLQFLDADDLLLPEKLAHQLRLAAEGDLIVGSYVKRSANGEETVIRSGSGAPWLDLFVTDLGITSANLWKTEVVRSLGGFAEELPSSQEYELMFRYLQYTARVVYDAEPLTVIRERPGVSVSQSNPRRKWEQYANLRTRILEYLSDRHDPFYEARGDDLKGAFVDVLHRLYPYNRRLATRLYQDLVGGGFRIPPTAPVGRLYRIIYNLGGFHVAGVLRGTRDRWRSLRRI
jgi:glycosyltransferase involved in cell wall biosynthesis